MAKNEQNFDERYTDEVIVKVKGGTHTADLIERLERDERFSKVTTPEDIKKVVKFYVAQAINSMEDDAKMYTVKPEDIKSANIAGLSHLKCFKNGTCSAKQFVNKLVDDILREQRDKWKTAVSRAESYGMCMPGMMAPNPNNNLFGAGNFIKMISNNPPDTLDKLMIMKTMSEHLEKDTAGVELECAHNITNTIYDSISEISLSKKSDIRAKNKE